MTQKSSEAPYCVVDINNYDQTLINISNRYDSAFGEGYMITYGRNSDRLILETPELFVPFGIDRIKKDPMNQDIVNNFIRCEMKNIIRDDRLIEFYKIIKYIEYVSHEKVKKDYKWRPVINIKSSIDSYKNKLII